MWNRIKDSFLGGIERVKWFASLLSERIKIEIAVFRLLYQSDQMNRERNEALKQIGSRLMEIRKAGESAVFKDQVIADAMKKVQTIDESINELKRKASEISSVTD